MKATIHSDTHHHVGPVDRRIFSGFLEHLGRAVYGGVYDPESPRSDANGFRQDVIAALRPVAMPVVRYPGGNYVSAFHWPDGIGPREQRPRRRDYAWKSIETNQFGTDEFMQWCAAAGTSAMMAVNLGTAGAAEAAALLEYCNMPAGTFWSDKRKENGRSEPYGVKLWCLGNEMDGPWQAGHCPADVYARKAREAAMIMKKMDPSIETVVCGSSGCFMPTYMEWDRVCLEECWDHVDYISAHRYSTRHSHGSPWFLAEGVEIDRVLQDYAGLVSYVRGRKRSAKNVHLSFDEWNVWHQQTSDDGKWEVAPHLLEEVYSLEDAIVCMQYMTAFIRHADLVKVACLAQITNVIAPVLVRPDGLLIQSIYHPWVMASRAAKGNSLRLAINSPTIAAGDRGEVPVIDAALTFDTDTGDLSVMLVNRSINDNIEVEVWIADRTPGQILSTTTLGGGGEQALAMANSWEQPDKVKPVQGKSHVRNNLLCTTVPGPGIAVVKMKSGQR